MTVAFGPRRATVMTVTNSIEPGSAPLTAAALGHLETLDLLYRALCALLYNYVPTSGHPGGSISSGRLLAALLFDTLEYDLAHPDREDADLVSLAAGHKVMGLYAMWALRDEVARLGAPDLLPDEPRHRMRLTDLLGFRRNPSTRTPLFTRFGAKALDGHPTPATPFVRLATGASGVGVASSIGLALGARDYFGAGAPRVHVLEGEGGLTPGRVAEALAAAGTASLDNVILHLDWNQASIDSNRVCRENGQPGEYVQWSPRELFHLHDWNVIEVPDGKDFEQVVAAQRLALRLETGQPTAIVYRTLKGWQYGMEGRASHGAGHRLCSEGFHAALQGLTEAVGIRAPSCEAGGERCLGRGDGEAVREECLWDALGLVRWALERNAPVVEFLAGRLVAARRRLDARRRRPRPDAPRIETVYELAEAGTKPPAELALAPGTVTTLRGELGRALQYLNRVSTGAFLVAAADLLGSTSVGTAGAGFAEGYWSAAANPRARLLSVGGICEDAMAGILAGASTFGHHVGVGSSYGAFLAPLGHIAARLHAIGAQARHAVSRDPYRPMILVCAHAGLKTGEDGPTHADPQPLQLLQENFPRGTAITLTPWEPREIWPLLTAALAQRPALIAPFVTRPSEAIPDRERLGLAPAEAASSGVYLLRRARGRGEGTVILQESGVTFAFVEGALPRLEADGLDLWVYYVASAELFDLLPADEQRAIFPEERARDAMGITGFTLPTMFRWIRSDRGRAATLHPYQHGRFLGSGAGERVLAEAGLDGASQYRAIKRFVEGRSA